MGDRRLRLPHARRRRRADLSESARAIRSPTSCATPAPSRSSCRTPSRRRRSPQIRAECPGASPRDHRSRDATRRAPTSRSPQSRPRARRSTTTRAAARTWTARWRVQPDDLATLIYTSGTTGEPKGVMLTHDNIYSNVMAARVAIPFAGDDVGLSFLPLSHIFERMAGHYLMFAHGHEHRLRRVDRHGAAQHDRGAADARALGAASVREDVRARARERALRRRAQEAASSSGRAASPIAGPT